MMIGDSDAAEGQRAARYIDDDRPSGDAFLSRKIGQNRCNSEIKVADVYRRVLWASLCGARRRSMLSSRIRHTLLNFSYILLILTVICALGISCFALIAQAVRVSPTRSFQHNSNVVIIGGSYVLVLVISLLLCIKRRVAVRQRLSRISKVYRAIGRNDVPKSVHNYITQEYGRACLVTYLSQPTDTVHEGWGRPGTKYEGIRFRRALLDAIPKIDALAHMIIPSHPALKPHTRMLHHFRYLLPLLPEDEDGLSILHYYDSSVQLARNSTREPTEKEFEMGIEAADEIMRNLHDVLLGMQEESTTQLNGPIEQL